MKTREKGGVVDSRLNVYGVDGLKVAGGFSCIAVHPGLRGKMLTENAHNRHVHLPEQRCCGKCLRFLDRIITDLIISRRTLTRQPSSSVRKPR